MTRVTNPPDIPGYQLLEFLGQGGMGAVYRARQSGCNRVVAVKVLAAPEEGGQQVVHLERESQLVASLHHPNVVSILESGSVAGQPFLVMEYVPGPSLRGLLRRGQPWPLATAIPLLDQVAQALSYIHGQGILHLDLKPENVLLAETQGRGVRACPSAPTSLWATLDTEAAVFIPKITDFGLARYAAAGLAEPRFAQGTLDYCPPELRHGLPIDERSDLFALATLAYEMVTGRLPGRIYRAAALHNGQLQPAMDDMLRRGLARDRDERYPSVESFRAALWNATALVQPSSPEVGGDRKCRTQAAGRSRTLLGEGRSDECL